MSRERKRRSSATWLAWAPLILALVGGVAPLSAAYQPAREKVSAFDFQGVRLHDGLMQSHLEQARQYYLSIPDSDLLKPYRERAGLPAPGGVLGGWYRENRFNVLGQIISGLARLHAATGDAACAEKANRLVQEWAKCIASDGYFFAAPPPHAPHYIYDKFVWGLLDSARYCGNSQSLKHLARITDWAEKNLDRTRAYAPSVTEWYTLSENLYRAYLVTGQERYREFAQVWDYTPYWDTYATNGSIFAKHGDLPARTHYHAYSHVNCLSGAAAAYRVTGRQKYLNTIVNAYNFLEAHELYATGGYGPDEKLLPPGDFLERIFDTHKSFETQCGSWAGSKLARELICLTGDAKYGDWAERLAINGLCATMPLTPDGKVLYYSDYNAHGAEKRQHPQPWSCCTGTRPQALAELDNLSWLHDDRNLYLNLFTPSEVRWKIGQQEVTVTQDTGFPLEPEVFLSVNLAAPQNFGIKVRVPGWLTGRMRALVNGKPAQMQADNLHWATLRRVWRNGDRVQITLPMGLWTKPLQAGSDTPYALLCGPTVLVFETSEPVRLARFSAPQLLHDLRQLNSHALEFTLKSEPGVSARPFCSIPMGRRYYMYLDPRIGSRVDHANLRYSGKWIDNGPHHVSTEPGAKVVFDFTGTGFKWTGNFYDDAGRAEVAVDRVIIAVVDQYGPRRGEPFTWNYNQLQPGRHHLTITLLPDPNPKSKNRFLNITALEPLK